MALISRLSSDHVLARVAGRLENERFAARVRCILPRILATIPTSAVSPDERHPGPITRTGTRVAIILLGPPTGAPTSILRIPQTRSGAYLVERQAAAERAIRLLPELHAWAPLVPEPLAEGRVGRASYLLERVLAGHAPRITAIAPDEREHLVGAAALAIGELHRATLQERVVDDDAVQRWVREPVARLRAGLTLSGRIGPYSRSLEQLEGSLSATLLGRRVPVSWIHGDYWPGNLLVHGRRIVGIVDWDRAGPGELPAHDVLHLLVYTRRLVSGAEPGRVVADALAGAPWGPGERATLTRTAGWPLLELLGEDTLLRLYWLRFVAATFHQADYFARNPRWLAENLDPVLRAS